MFSKRVTFRGAENILEFCRNFFNSVNVTPASRQSDELLIGGVDGDADAQQVTYKLPPNCEEMLSMFNITNSSNNMVRELSLSPLPHVT